MKKNKALHAVAIPSKSMSFWKVKVIHGEWWSPSSKLFTLRFQASIRACLILTLWVVRKLSLTTLLLLISNSGVISQFFLFRFNNFGMIILFLRALLFLFFLNEIYYAWFISHYMLIHLRCLKNWVFKWSIGCGGIGAEEKQQRLSQYLTSFQFFKNNCLLIYSLMIRSHIHFVLLCFSIYACLNVRIWVLWIWIWYGIL